MRGLRGRGRTLVGAALALGLVGASAGPIGTTVGTASLEIVPATSAYREPVRVAGALAAEAACLEDRPATLERRAAGAGAWEDVAVTRTGPDGSFSFVLRPEAGVRYRAVLDEGVREGTICAGVTSDEATSKVRALVEIRRNDLRLRASRCDRVPVVVLPPKPGQTVEVERRVSDGWRSVGTATLDDASRAVVPICVRWADLGRMRLRARWAAQDRHNLRGLSEPRWAPVVRARWMREIDWLAGGLAMGVSVREAGAFVYRRADAVPRTPASNQKLLMSMALLDRLPSEIRLPTTALAGGLRDGAVRGDLWLVGRGDPDVGPAKLRRLARRLAEAGLRRVRGSVRGSTRYFGRDWWAPGWRSYFPSRTIPLATALTFRGNAPGGRHVGDPERHAARELTRQLRRAGVRVAGEPGAGAHPGGLQQLAEVRSRPMDRLLATTNTLSANFLAEMLGKRLGVAADGSPGSIAKGAAATARWARANGVGIVAHDASGLSYANRATPAGIARLLEAAEARPWVETLRSGLATGGTGTLGRRLIGEPIRAKTGTLASISALSGWVLADRTGTWVEFSIMSSGPTARAKDIEDRIVRILRRQAA